MNLQQNSFLKQNRGNRTPRTEYQKLLATFRMLYNNPMKKPENREKQRQRMLGKKPINPFEKGNSYSKLRKNKKHSERTKEKISEKMKRHHSYDFQKLISKYLMLNWNPMKYPAIVQKWRNSRKNE
jgi:hypothetical protein